MRRRDQLLERLAFLIGTVDRVPAQAATVLAESRAIAEELGLAREQLEELLRIPEDRRESALHAVIDASPADGPQL